MKWYSRIIVLMMLLLSSNIIAYSQVFTDNSVISPAKTANEFMGNIHYNVDHQTGALRLRLPLLSLKVDDGLEIPVEIMYNGNGIKFDQFSGEIGVGWSISTNYKINRTMYCRPDEHYPKPTEQTLSEYYLNLSDNYDENVIRDQYLTQFTFGLPSSGGLMIKSGLQELDGEYDIFDYNTPGLSGTFIIEDPQHKTIASSDNPLIKINYSVNLTRGIDSISILDQKGNKYFAGFDYSNNSFISESIPRYGKQASYSWPITRIATPNNKYAEIKYKLIDIFERSYDQLALSVQETGGTWSGRPQTSFSNETDASVNNRKAYLTASVSSQYGELKFFRGQFSKEIDSVVLYNLNKNAVKRVVFCRSTNLDFNFLDSIVIYGEDQKKGQTYAFSYINKNTGLNNYLCDIWGNIKKYGTSSGKFLPEELKTETYISSDAERFWRNLLEVPPNNIIPFTNRSPFGVPDCYSLEQMRLPSGGYVKYGYEANFFRDNYSNQIFQGPGVRLFTVEVIDSLSKPYSFYYKYGENDDGAGSIPVRIDPTFFCLDQLLLLVDDYSPTTRTLLPSRTRLFSNDVISDGDPFFVNYNFVSYPVISEITPDGKEKFYYKTGRQFTWSYQGEVNRSYYTIQIGQPIPTERRPGFIFDYNLQNKPLLEKKETFNKAGELVKSETFEYKLFRPKDFLQLKIKPYAVFGDGYFDPQGFYTYDGFHSIYDCALNTLHFGSQLLTKRVVSDKRNNQSVNETTEYAYNTNDQLIKEKVYQSNLSHIETQYTYPNNFSDLQPANQITQDIIKMQNSNILDQWIEKRVYVKKNIEGVENSNIVTAEFQHYFPGTNKIRNKYSFVNNKQPTSLAPVDTSSIIIHIDDRYQKETIEIVKTDPSGNILTQKDQNGLLISYLWGYNNSYPVAKVVGTDYNTLIQHVDPAILNNGSDIQIKQELANLRSALVNNPLVQVYTYTHKPLVGITSETDPKGISTFYDYDSLQRLWRIKDQKGKVIKEHKYHYKQ